MKVKDIHIQGVGGIQDLKIQFDSKMNFLCGPNGIGKTTIIECISHLFVNSSTQILKRNVNSKASQIVATVEKENADTRVEITFNEFEPSSKARINGLRRFSKWLLSLKTSRIFDYQPLNAINKDPEKNEANFSNEAMRGLSYGEVKNWFVNRFLYSGHKGTLDEEQIANYELAKECFSVLDNNFSFKTVKASSNEIIIDTPDGEIYYEYLSSGFKSCLSILFGIIKEIEFRFNEPKIKASDFSGIVLIDEIELHLHPLWQSKIAVVLSRIFPKIQFITTTHSPHVIQSAEPNQILAIEQNQNGKRIRPLPASKYGFKGWTVEEVLLDVMGMQDVRTNEFDSILSQFEEAIETENYGEAYSTYQEIDEMLHPDNDLRKLLKFQLVSIKEEPND